MLDPINVHGKYGKVFEDLGGEHDDNSGDWPFFDSKPLYTPSGTAYLGKPGVALVAKPQFNINNFASFIGGFDESLGFGEYTDDPYLLNDNDGSCDGTELIKAAGQLCYLSFGPTRTKNVDVQRYIDNILSSGHGSVLEHAQYSFLIWGADRAFTHEAVRHRAGVAFSQVSQRYVDGKVLRFVERPEWKGYTDLHTRFLDRIDRSAREYDELSKALVERQVQGDVALSGEKRTEMRKKVNQAARSSLPNETEAPILMSGNIRALRHICEMRASGAADVPIRDVTTRVFLCMSAIEPVLFNDYELKQLPDSTYAVETKWRKV